MNPDQQTGLAGFLKSRTGLVLLGFLAIAGYFLITEHTAHLVGALPLVLPFALPLVLLLCCVLMMLFMHGGHGGQADEHTGHSSGPTTGGSNDGHH
jgi:hypothetical protein